MHSQPYTRGSPCPLGAPGVVQHQQKTIQSTAWVRQTGTGRRRLREAKCRSKERNRACMCVQGSSTEQRIVQEQSWVCRGEGRHCHTVNHLPFFPVWLQEQQSRYCTKHGRSLWSPLWGISHAGWQWAPPCISCFADWPEACGHQGSGSKVGKLSGSKKKPACPAEIFKSLLGASIVSTLRRNHGKMHQKGCFGRISQQRRWEMVLTNSSFSACHRLHWFAVFCH